MSTAAELLEQGKQLKTEGDLEAAVAKWREASAADSENADVRGALINGIYDLGNQKKEEGELEAAVGLWQEILSIDESHVLSHMALGVHLQKLERPDEAIKHAVRVAELEPNDPFSYTQLSVIYQRCGKIQEAEDAMAKAHEIQHGGPRPH